MVEHTPSKRKVRSSILRGSYIFYSLRPLNYCFNSRLADRYFLQHAGRKCHSCPEHSLDLSSLVLEPSNMYFHTGPEGPEFRRRTGRNISKESYKKGIANTKLRIQKEGLIRHACPNSLVMILLEKVQGGRSAIKANL